MATGGMNLQVWLISSAQDWTLGKSLAIEISSNIGSVVEHCMSILYSPGVKNTTVHS